MIICLVAEDGKELYLINSYCDFSRASDWVVENVLKPMGILTSGAVKISPAEATAWTPKREIAQRILEFLEPYVELEFWADYSAYDWVAMCQIFGTMMELPEGFPMFCRDVQQEWERQGRPKLPKQDSAEHNALNDAKHCMRLYRTLHPKRVNRNPGAINYQEDLAYG